MPSSESSSPGPEPDPRRARSLFRRLEPFLWIGLGIFLLVRFSPQLSAWTGIGIPHGEAPAFEVTTLDQVAVGPEQVNGKIQVLTFWATWCRVCRYELPALQRIHDRWGDREDVVVLALSIDRGGAGMVRQHMEEAGLSLPVALVDHRVRALFGGVRAVPTTFIVDRDGVIRHRMIGVSGPGTLQRAVQRLVDEEGEVNGR